MARAMVGFRFRAFLPTSVKKSIEFFHFVFKGRSCK